MRSLFLLLVAAGLVWSMGCDGDVGSSSPAAPMEPGIITGAVQLGPDVTGSVEGTTVSIYTSREDAMLTRPTTSVVVDKWGSFEFASVYPGKYYLSVSKDNDNDGVLDSGDYATDRSNHENCCCDVKSCCTSAVYPCVYVIP